MFYTLREVAAMLRVSTKTIIKWTQEGYLPRPLVVAQTKRWPKSAIDKFLSTAESEEK